MRKFIFITVILIVFGGCNCNRDSFQIPETSDVVIYQINPRVFASEKSFNAVLLQLDQIKKLGCNTLWLMPVFPIGEEKSKNSPYSVKDYYKVNPEFGTLSDFRKLIKESHKRDMAVIIDWVLNHTAWDNEWIKNRDWYTQDSLGNIVHPQGTDWTDVADLNFDNKDMRLAMIQAMKYWITEVGVDGFRCDAVDFVPYDFLKQCNDSLRAIPKKLLLLAEGKRPDHFNAGFDLNYGWDFIAQMRKVYRDGESAASIFEAHNEEYEGLPESKLKLRFITNHDESAKHSPVVEWNSDRGSMSAFAVILFLPGVPMIYSSQETGYPAQINFFQYVPVNWNENSHLTNEYQRLLGLYNCFNVLRHGDLEFYTSEDILLFERISENEKIIVAINVRNKTKSIYLPVHMANNNYVNLYTDRNLSLGSVLTLQSYEYLILK